MSNINPQKTIEIPNISSTIEDSRGISYAVSVIGEQVAIRETVRPLRPFSETIGSIGVTVILESFIGGVTKLIDEYKKPLHFRENISAEEWKRSLSYSENEVQQVLVNILEDFELETNEENIEWLKTSMRQLLSLYETKYQVQLTPGDRSMLTNLIIRMVHDRLCIKSMIA